MLSLDSPSSPNGTHVKPPSISFRTPSRLCLVNVWSYLLSLGDFSFPSSEFSPVREMLTLNLGVDCWFWLWSLGCSLSPLSCFGLCRSQGFYQNQKLLQLYQQPAMSGALNYISDSFPVGIWEEKKYTKDHVTPSGWWNLQSHTSRNLVLWRVNSGCSLSGWTHLCQPKESVVYQGFHKIGSHTRTVGDFPNIKKLMIVKQCPPSNNEFQEGD